MMNKEKIEQWLSTNSDIVEWEFISQPYENLFIYVLNWNDEHPNVDAIYDLSVNEDNTISCLKHIRE